MYGLGKSQDSEMPHTSVSGHEKYFISDKMGENARSNVFDASKCLSEAHQNAKFGILYVLV